MTDRILADLVLFVHTAFVAFVVLGLVLTLVGGVRRWRWVRNIWFRLAHLAAIGIVVAQAWGGLVCPLTTLENDFRRGAGERTYSGGFIADWVHRLLFYDFEPWVFTVAYSAFGGLVVAAWVFVRPRGFKRHRAT